MKEDKSDYDTQIKNIVRDFVDRSNDRILILTGRFGQCMRDVVRSVENEVVKTSRKPPHTVLAPAARISYPAGSKSVYGVLYERKPHFDKGKEIFVHERKHNRDCVKQLYIIGDAHLIGKSPWGSSRRQFGSGYLLNDLMDFILNNDLTDFTDLYKPQRRAIFIGDPYQISSSSMSQVTSKLREYSKSVQHIPLEGFQCTQWPEIFLENRELLAKRIRTRQFHRLSIRLDEKHCIQLSDLPGDIDQLVKNDSATLVAHTHVQVNQYNRGIRKRAFGRGTELTGGDRVVSYNHIRFRDTESPEKYREIHSGSFGTVTKILGKETIEQRLRGRKNPIRIKILRVHILWENMDHLYPQEHLCFEDFLYAEKPELGADEFIALTVYTRKWGTIGKYAQEQIYAGVADKKNQRKRNLSKDQWYAILECAKTQLNKKSDKDWNAIRKYAQKQVGDKSAQYENRRQRSLTKIHWELILKYATTQANIPEILVDEEEYERWSAIFKYAQDQTRDSKHSKEKSGSLEEANLSKTHWEVILKDAKTQADDPEKKNVKTWNAILKYAQEQVNISEHEGDKSGLSKTHWKVILKYAKTRLGKTKEDLSGPYLDAAMLRFGYAITLHRAQGCLFDTVIGDLSPRGTMGGKGYFQWLYTAFSVPKKRLHLINVPRKTPFDKTIWEFEKSKLDPSIQPRNPVGYDPSSPNPAPIGDFPTDREELCNLYWFICERLDTMGIKVSNLVHHQYQEAYTFKKNDDCKCAMQLYYNSKFQVTRISVLKSKPSDFASQIQKALAPHPVFPDTFTEEIFDAFRNKIDPCGIQITAVDHHDFQEIYFIEGDAGKARIRVHYTKTAAVTKIVLERHSSENIRDCLISIFET